MNVAAGFAKRFTAEQGLLTMVAFVALALLCPWVLRLDTELVLDVVGRSSAMGLAATLASVLVAASLVRRHRWVLRALAMGSRAVEPQDVDGLRRLPYVVAWMRFLVSAPCMLALGSAWIRPRDQSGEAARELALLGVTVLLATSVPGFVLAQKGVGRLLEIAPLEPVSERIVLLDERGSLGKRSRQNLVLAVVVPVALVGVAGTLASYAHLRALNEKSREMTAIALARGVVGSGDTPRGVGQDAAIKVARERGYTINLSEVTSSESVQRTPDDRLHLAVPLPRGSATVDFGVGLGFENTFPLAALALGFVALAAAAAASLARLVSDDLSSSAERLRTLGTERVMRGTDEGFVARFGVVQRLGEAALRLAGRFGVFAAAQERALDAKETARRMRGLLFASVSHDLKTPLNAIVGFADSIDPNTLTAAQKESLDLISTRGRELVALIETILDAARVEASELTLSKRRIAGGSFVAIVAKRAQKLAGDSGVLKVELADDLPFLDVDVEHLGRALGVIVAHALRSQTADGTPPRVILRAALGPAGKTIRIDVDHGKVTVSAAELGALLWQEAGARAKGLTLGLGLARAIIDLHQGQVTVTGGAEGGAIVSVSLPSGAAPKT
jgi:signal transduction histidine kinase